MKQSITLVVDDAPPAKDGGKSIRSSAHWSSTRVAALREKMCEVMAQNVPFEKVPLRLEMHYWRGRGRGDALNLINGVADIIQQRCHREDQRFHTWVIDDDSHIREFHYSEEPATQDRYRLTISVL